jgi:hypothetical protein
MICLAGLLAVGLTYSQFDQTTLRRIVIIAAGLQALLPLGYALAIVCYVPTMGNLFGVTWPQAEIIDQMHKIWARETRRPLRIVTGDPRVAGLIALGRDHPTILGNDVVAPAHSLSRARLEAEGLLVVWEAQSKRIPLPSLALLQPIREERFVQRYPSGERTIVIEYAVIPPQGLRDDKRTTASAHNGLLRAICGFRLCRWPSAEYVGFVDLCDRTAITGWAQYGRKATSVNIIVNGKVVATVAGKGMRPDVAKVMGGDAQAGFYFPFPNPLHASDKVWVEFANGQLLGGSRCTMH